MAQKFRITYATLSADNEELQRSYDEAAERVKAELGKEYPVIKVEISSASHPFYTGKHKVIDSGGRVDKFRKRYGAQKA